MSERQATLHDERIDLLSAMVVDLRARLAAAEAERDAALKELMAARVYIGYTCEMYHHDTEQDELWRIWHDARAAAQDGKP